MSCSGEILVVDDDQALRETLKDVLEIKGYSVCLAADGLEAVEAVKQWPYSLVIMDIRMPKKDGLAALREITESRPELPVALMTAYQMDKENQDAVLNRATAGLFIKPFDMEAFLAMVERNCPRTNRGERHG